MTDGNRGRLLQTAHRCCWELIAYPARRTQRPIPLPGVRRAGDRAGRSALARALAELLPPLFADLLHLVHLLRREDRLELLVRGLLDASKLTAHLEARATILILPGIAILLA